MFLSMMTADAAAQHGHEFSSRRTSSSSATGSPGRATPRSSILPASLLKQSIGPASTMRRASPAGRRPTLTKSVTFTESDLPTPPSLDLSRSNSVAGSDASASQPRSKTRTPPRPKTVYNIAHPPPEIVPRQKLHLNPKVILQLQQLSADARPRPAFEVVPSMKFAPKTKAGRKLGNVLRGKVGLGPEDVLVTRAEDYGTNNGADGRDIVGLVCSSTKEDAGANGSAEIIMDDCSVWEATALANGGYEFVNVDDHGLRSTVRWVCAGPGSRRKTKGQDGGGVDDKKFNFSTITPNSRRHPIIGSMTRTSITVSDIYTLPSPTSEPSTPTSAAGTPMTTQSEGTSYLDAADPTTTENRVLIPTDELLKKLIIVTAVWVAIREDWSPAFHYSSPLPQTPTTPTLQPSGTTPTSTSAAAGSSFTRRAKTVSSNSPRPRWRSSLSAPEPPALSRPSSSRPSSPRHQPQSPTTQPRQRPTLKDRRAASHSPSQSPRTHSAPAPHHRRFSACQRHPDLASPSAADPPSSPSASDRARARYRVVSASNGMSSPTQKRFSSPALTNSSELHVAEHADRGMSKAVTNGHGDAVDGGHGKKRFGRLKGLLHRLGRKGSAGG